MATVSYPHIQLSVDGVPYLEGTRTKVIEIALDSLAHHWDAEEIQRQHPHLTMGQIHAALAYYHRCFCQMEKPQTSNRVRMGSSISESELQW